MTKKQEQVLVNLQDKLIKKLLEKIEDGTATSSDLNVARQLLKDNDITVSDEPDTPVRNLKNSLGLTEEDLEFVSAPNAKTS